MINSESCNGVLVLRVWIHLMTMVVSCTILRWLSVRTSVQQLFQRGRKSWLDNEMLWVPSTLLRFADCMVVRKTSTRLVSAILCETLSFSFFLSIQLLNKSIYSWNLLVRHGKAFSKRYPTKFMRSMFEKYRKLFNHSILITWFIYLFPLINASLHLFITFSWISS